MFIVAQPAIIILGCLFVFVSAPQRRSVPELNARDSALLLSRRNRQEALISPPSLVL
jgi:hypothetical protein